MKTKIVIVASLARFAVLLLSVFLTNISFIWADAGKPVKTEKKPETIIKGQVVDSQGNGVAGVKVSCHYLIKENFPMPLLSTNNNGKIVPVPVETLSDQNGRYEFNVPVWDKPYEIHAGDSASTATQSNIFCVQEGDIYQVEKLIVRTANKSCKGRVVFEDGQPAANLSYGYISKSFCPLDPQNQPKTNDKGEFTIAHLLPDELFSVWVFPKENTLCVWKRLDPNSGNLELTLKTSEYIDLPADWFMYGTDAAIANNMSCVPDSRIQFRLPDLSGKIISLDDPQFKNKAVLVNIYGSWCGGCIMEIPYLVNFKDQYQKDGLEVIGIAFENGTKEEQLEAVEKISRKYKVNYPVLIGGLAEKVTVAAAIRGLEDFQGYPTTLYIDRNGLVKHIQVGFWISSKAHKDWQLRQMEDKIKSLLNVE